MSMKNSIYKTIALALALALAGSISVAYAQGQSGGSSGGSGSAGGTGTGASGGSTQTDPGTQDRDQDQVRDPSTHDGDEPLQTQDQDRDQDQDKTQDQDQDRTQDQIRDPSTHDGDEPLETQDRDRDQDRDGVEDEDEEDGELEDEIELEDVKERAQNAEQLRAMVEERLRVLQGEATSSPEALRLTLENQNQIRAAVHAFLAAEDLVGGIGPRVSELAKQINEEVQNTVRTEEEIRSRGALARFFFGGDDAAAGELEQYREEIQAHVQEMTQLVGTCDDCDAQVRVMLQEHLQEMEQEQERLRDVVEEELDRRGLFGFLFGWLR